MKKIKLLAVLLICLSLVFSVSAFNWSSFFSRGITGGVAFSGAGACGSFVNVDSVLTGDVGPCTDGFTLNANVTLDCNGFHILGDGNFSGVRTGVQLFDGAVVKNCVISDFFDGVRSNSGSGISVINNTVYNVTNGLDLQNVNGANILGNIFFDVLNGVVWGSFNSVPSGLNNVIVDNVIFNTGQNGISLSSNFSNNFVIGNNLYLINGSGIFLGVASSGNSIINNSVDKVGGRGITLSQFSNNNLVQDNIVSNTDVGILIDKGSIGNDLKGNSVLYGVTGGVAVEDSSSNIIQFNDIGMNGVGVTVRNSSSTVVQFNNVGSNSLFDLNVLPDSFGSMFTLNFWGVFPPIVSQFSGIIFPEEISPVLDGPYPGGSLANVSLPDFDSDGVFNNVDNCPLIFNPDQTDSDAVEIPEFRQFDGTDKFTCNSVNGFWCPDLNLTDVCVFDIASGPPGAQALVCDFAAADGSSSACDAAAIPVFGADLSYLCNNKCVLDGTLIDPFLIEQCSVSSDGFGDVCDNCPFVQNQAVPIFKGSYVIDNAFSGGSGFNLSGGDLLYYGYAPAGTFGNPFDVSGFVDGPTVSGLAMPVSGVSLDFARVDCASAVDVDFSALDPVSGVSGAALWMPPAVLNPSVVCVRDQANPLSMWQLENFSSFNSVNVNVDVYRIQQPDSNNNGIGDACEVTVACVNPPSGLVSWWSGEGSAVDIQDGNDGSLVNGVLFAPGKVGQAFSFDGVDDYVEIPNNPSLAFSNAVTVDAWVNPKSFGASDNFIVHKGGVGPGSGPHYALWLSTNKNFVFRVNVGGTQYTVTSGTLASVNSWYHVAGVYTGSALEIYVNGILEASTPVSGTLSTSVAPVRIGRNPKFGFFWNGLIDEVEIFNRALSSSEIQSIFNADTEGKCKLQCDDSDGDGYGVSVTVGCSAGLGIDCDDTNSSIFPSSVVESDLFGTDSVGLCQVQVQVCNGLTGGFDVTQPAVGPIQESCDALDNDCDGVVDDGFNVGVACVSSPNNCGDTVAGTIQCNLAGGSECNAMPPTDRPLVVAYVDADSDGFGSSVVVDATCGVPVGAVSNSLDCVDSESAINPDALGSLDNEGVALLCDGIDNNCDGVVDDGCPVCVTGDNDGKKHFQSTKGTPRTDDDDSSKNILTVRGVGFDSYEGNSDDDLFVILANGDRLNVKTDVVPANQLITGLEIESTELVPLALYVDKKNSIKVDHVLKGKDGDNLFSYSGRYFSLWAPFFSWVYTWDTASVDASGDPDYAGFASLGITTSDRFKVHLDLKPLECKEIDDDDEDDDGIPDVVDDDDDNDGILDDNDKCLVNGVLSDCSHDFDNDGYADLNDDDDDNDGKKDNKDKHKRDKNKK